ncbi:sorcin-like [Trematomus bernacchii]|uniref:sorcin-like n=1 Tax=Trematomus bernacchii TaxID=40690 RepID=UPI00146A3B71|nr:sorcin-like [Trematomus bernacchii]
MANPGYVVGWNANYERALRSLHDARVQAQADAHNPMWGFFTAIAGQDGEVDADELQRCLTQGGFTGSYSPFNLETAMMDRDSTRKMGLNEFKDLFAALNLWKQTFVMFDRDRSGTVEPQKMALVINAMGFILSPQAQNVIIKRYNKGGRIYFDDYVACCIKLHALTENFKRKDTMQHEAVSFQYDDFILCTMGI